MRLVAPDRSSGRKQPLIVDINLLQVAASALAPQLRQMRAVVVVVVVVVLVVVLVLVVVVGVGSGSYICETKLERERPALLSAASSAVRACVGGCWPTFSPPSRTPPARSPASLLASLTAESASASPSRRSKQLEAAVCNTTSDPARGLT